MLKILLSNDDGVYAQGLHVLRETLADIADITIVAPDRDRSGASNSLSLTRPLRVKNIDQQVYSIEGTPTDCVHVALTGLLDERPDMVISGINAGANLGDDVWYSGTVAAAREGRFLGLPAIAVSLASDQHNYYDTAAQIVKEMVLHLKDHPLQDTSVLNVNVPDVEFSALSGIAVTRLGTRHCAEPTIKTTDPRGKTIYWVGPAGKEADAGEGTDFYALKQNQVSITPLSIDITQYNSIDALAEWGRSLETLRIEK